MEKRPLNKCSSSSSSNSYSNSLNSCNLYVASVFRLKFAQVTK